MSQFHERYGLTPIINACGKMTHLGAAAVPPEVTSRVMEVMSEFVDMPALLQVADEAIADATGAEGGTVTHCAAAGITVTCAGAMTGDDLGKVLSLPDTTGMKNEVIIQKGHAVNFGAPITQMIRMTGATAVEFGEVNRALPDHMARAITANTAAAVFVLSHHTVQHNQLSFAEFVDIAASHGVPVIVDGAAEAFLARELLEQGAAAVVFSDQKHLNGFTAGVVAGSRALIDATARQGMGLGRAMKPTKEGIVSVIATMEWLRTFDRDAYAADMDAKSDSVVAAMAAIPGVAAIAEPDITGNPQTRAKIIVDPDVAGTTAETVCEALKAGTPSIHPRAHHVDEGFFYIDPVELRLSEVPTVIARLQEILESAKIPAGV